MRKIVNGELKALMPPGLNKIQQKLWRFYFNMVRQMIYRKIIQREARR